MCGLAAFYSPAAVLRAQWPLSAAQKVRHRGPDDEGFVFFYGPDATPSVHGGPDTAADAYSSGLPYAPGSEPAPDGARIALAHRRLSILDLTSAGHQPMCTPDREIWVVFNGEIYNYIELRDELRSLGHAFATRCDTEVILAAYRQWGHECLPRFNGMFAFILFDRARGRLFAARDRFGVKPLYYWVAPDGTIAMASEIKQFTVLPGWTARVNGQRAYDFLNWALLDHTDETLFEGVFQLRGGEWLEIDVSLDAPVPRPGARLPARRWYELRPRPFAGTLPEAAAEFHALLTDSVRIRLRADVPVGSCLSGGLDSSSIVCVMNGLLRARHAQKIQKSFSACATVSRFDERRFIDEVVRATGIEAHYVYPRVDDAFGLLDRMTWLQDEPFGSTSIFAQWRVFELAAGERVKVMLDGQGADEQLAGYHNYFAPRFGSLLRAFEWREWLRETQSARSALGYSFGWSIQQTLNDLLPEAVRQPLRRLAGQASTSTPWLDTDRLNAVPGDPFFAAGAARAGSVQAMSRSQLTSTALPMLLHAEDRDSMAHSVEARVPFLDYRLVEFTLGLPDAFKIAGGETKRVLREGMRGVLPEPVRTRTDKLGFATPEEVWLRDEGTARFREALERAVETSEGAIRPEVMKLFERMVEGRARFSFLIWRVISFGAWLRAFTVRI